MMSNSQRSLWMALPIFSSWSRRASSIGRHAATLYEKSAERERQFLTTWLCVWAWKCLCARAQCVPVGFVGRDSSLRFSSHSWSCFLTLLMRVFWRETHTWPSVLKCCQFYLNDDDSLLRLYLLETDQCIYNLNK